MVCMAASAEVRVTDAGDGMAVPAATVFSTRGPVLGLTDSTGVFAGADAADFPLTVRCLGYEDASVAHDGADVALHPASYALGEYTVTPLDRPVMRLVCYVREYASGSTTTDTMQYFAEHTGDFYMTTTKVKGFKAPGGFRPLKSRMRERISDNRGTDSVATLKEPDLMLSWIGMVQLPQKTMDEPEAMRGGAKADTVQGKYGVKTVMRRTDEAFSISTDALADHKGHRFSPMFFKLLGLTMDMTELRQMWLFGRTDDSRYRAADLLMGTLAIDITGRGKWIKKAFHSNEPVQLHGYYEIYPLRVEYLTVEEAKAQQGDRAPQEELTVSPRALPLPEAVARIMKRGE